MVTTEVVKAAQFAGAIAVTAGPTFAWLIWRPAISGRRDEESAPLGLIWPAAALGAGALLLFGLLDLLRFARVAANQPLAEAGASLLFAAAGGTVYGRMILLRFVLGAGILILPRLPLSARCREVLLALCGLVALGSFTMASHAAATVGSGPWPALADLTHQAAAALWTGGLAFLAMAPWRTLAEGEEGRALLRRATARFSALGLAAVATLAATGTYLASLRIYGPLALVETDYGSSLLTKVVLVLSVVGVAAVNRFLLLPALHVRRAALWLHGLVGLEVALAAVALTFAADLTILSTAEEPPVRVRLVAEAGRFDVGELTVPLGRRVRLTLENETDKPVSFVVREFQHRLEQGPGAVRHPEMLLFAPPADRLWLEAKPGKRVVAEFVPLEEGVFTFTDGTQSRLGRLTVMVGRE
ncbi:MAG: CopD family protein [Bacillota bacterium]